MTKQHMSIFMSKITKDEFYKAKVNKSTVVVERPIGFVTQVGPTRTAYISHENVYYKGPMQTWQSAEQFNRMTFLGINTEVSADFESTEPMVIEADATV